MAKKSVAPKPREAKPPRPRPHAPVPESDAIAHRFQGAPRILTDELDRLVTDYEDRWRAAALEGRPQFRGTACGGTITVNGGVCAWTIGEEHATLTIGVLVDWRCPECGWRAIRLPQVMIHLNNAHHFNWLDLANKFRPTLEAGLVGARGKAVA